MKVRFRWPHVYRLQWKLTLTYTLVTTAAILVVEVALVVVAWGMLLRSNAWPKLFIPMFEDAVADIAPSVAARPPDTVRLQQWLETLSRSGKISTESSDSSRQHVRLNLSPAALSLTIITDAEGRVLATFPDRECTTGMLVENCLPPVALQPVQAAFQGEKAPDRLVVRARHEVFLAVPIYKSSAEDEVVGTFVAQIVLPRWTQLPREILGMLFPSALIILLLAVPVGTLFGFLAARGLTRRLTALANAADAWGRGDFSLFVHDTSRDELGQVARRLNRMAEELQNLLQAREELAAIEERHRLARDLHDSVKQQVFATTLQIAAARNLLDTHPDQAKEHLAEAERLAHQAQQELTALIRELRPAALTGKGLAAALQEYVETWARQSGIHADLRLRGERPLPLHIEQAVFRVIQEALANVVKHSGADAVTVTLLWSQSALDVVVEDNGQGFHVQGALSKGLGLNNMAERVRALGGEFRIVSHPGQGTRLSFRIPLNEESAHQGNRRGEGGEDFRAHR